MSVRVRFAPSPTGYLHVGGARTALFNWLFARKHGGTFILRIEDTDDARNTGPALDAILDGMRWLGLDWDEGPDAGGDHGPYFQSQRRHIYDAHLERLQAAGRVYEEDNGAIRFRFSREAITIPDLVCGEVRFAPTEEPDMTVRRPDGSYIFHFVNVVDDIEMGITHVFRGEDHLSNTWKHIDLFNALGCAQPVYAHIPLILNPDGGKMSKRDKGAAVGGYSEAGYLPEAVFNYLCLLGWTPRAESEKLDRQTLVDLFDPAEIHSSNARFDHTKLNWLNGLYLRELRDEDITRLALPVLTGAGLPVHDPEVATAAVRSVLEKVSTLAELPSWTSYFFTEPAAYEDDAASRLQANTGNADLLAAAEAEFGRTDPWTGDSIHAALEQAAAASSVKPGALMPLLRAALSGQMRGPSVTTIASLIGRERTLQRLRSAIQFIAT
jgi:glutamyl-tRNA synthetase